MYRVSKGFLHQHGKFAVRVPPRYWADLLEEAGLQEARPVTLRWRAAIASARQEHRLVLEDQLLRERTEPGVRSIALAGGRPAFALEASPREHSGLPVRAGLEPMHKHRIIIRCTLR